jgi:hypothetical protein
MSAESELFEYYFASDTLRGLIRTMLETLRVRYVVPKNQTRRRFYLTDLYIIMVVLYAVSLDIFQTLRTRLAGKPRVYPEGMWQDYLHWGLREDLGHFTNETIGYHQQRPPQATPLDDLTAWVMTVIQFVWGYEELMGVIWDEWTMLRLVLGAAEEAGLQDEEMFQRLIRQWEIQRPYAAPLNGTYADVRWAKFYAFYRRTIDALPERYQEEVSRRYKEIAATRRRAFQSQMSLLARLIPGRYRDARQRIPLWDARIGLVLNGRYYLIHVATHNEHGEPIVYGPGGTSWPLRFQHGRPVDPDGERLRLDGDQFYRVRDNQWVGYLDMAPASYVEWQLREILNGETAGKVWPEDNAVDVLLAETPRRFQTRLRGLLSPATRQALDALSYASVILNWDEKSRDRSLAELRRTHRGVGDHALTIIRTADSIIFDMSHMFFDGTWSVAMAEVLTSAAVQWCRRIIEITPSEAPPPGTLHLEPTHAFVKDAQAHRQPPEISAETTIFDISVLFNLRQMLAQTGTRLTINDLLIITRLFHTAHYTPKPAVRTQIEEFKARARTPQEKQVATAIDRSLKRGRVTNPALLIPVDASLGDPQAWLYPIVFRNLSDGLVWVWDETWEAYQTYRRIEPPDTPEGIAALEVFGRRRAKLISELRGFSYFLAANKAVGQRGHSSTVAMSELLVGLPDWLQHLFNRLPENLVPLNEIIKGDEVYSNVGRVAERSSLTRFMTAKDDGNTKDLAWGIMTDDNGRMMVTMRDFRPHVRPLIEAGYIDLARSMAQDYVVSYTEDLIGLVARLTAMLQVRIG